VSLALNEATVDNGCLVLVGGSGVGGRKSLRPHAPLMSKKENLKKDQVRPFIFGLFKKQP